MTSVLGDKTLTGPPVLIAVHYCTLATKMIFGYHRDRRERHEAAVPLGVRPPEPRRPMRRILCLGFLRDSELQLKFARASETVRGWSE